MIAPGELKLDISTLTGHDLTMCTPSTIFLNFSGIRNRLQKINRGYISSYHDSSRRA